MKFGVGLMAPKNTPSPANASPVYRLVDDSQSHDADEDQISRDDEIQEARDDQNEYAGSQRDDGLQVSDSDNHVGAPFEWGRG